MVTCPSCGAGFEQRTRFCPECGEQMVDPTGSREFKVVTTVFCDVVDSTALGRQLGAVRTREIMDHYGRTVRAVLGELGGRVGKRHGDGFMAAFGIPELHEDDAVRAVRAAARLRERLRPLADEVGRDHQLRLQVRLGINTGQVLVSDAGTVEEDLTGDAVNVAKRLEETAVPDEILVGEETYWLVRDAVRAEKVEPLEVEGLAGPVHAYRVLGVVQDGPGRLHRAQVPMVGRDLELRLLLQLFERVVAEPRCHLLTLFGAAGVGKSRLVDELAIALGDRATVLRGHCLPMEDSATFWPMVEVVRQAAGIAPTDDPDTVFRKLAALLGGAERAELITRRVAQVLGHGDDPDLPEDTAWALRRLLETLAWRRPVVVVVDDLHWAQPTLLDALEHVSEYAREAPVLLVCLARPDELFARRRHWPGGKTNAVSVELAPLGERHGEQLITHLLGGKPLDQAARAHITQLAQGNPLIAEELVATLKEQGKLVEAGARWEVTTDLAAEQLPTSIRALLLARLERLDPDRRSVLERAAVVGGQFHAGDIRALWPRDRAAEVDRTLQLLVRMDLILPDYAAAAPLTTESGDGYRFRHLLVRSVVYERMPDDLRAKLHEQFAGYLEDTAGERLSQFDEIVGDHLQQAYRYARRLAPSNQHTGELARRAGERLAAAGLRAAVRGDIQLIADLFGQAARLLPEGHPMRLQALPPLAEALQATGELTAAISAYEEVTKAAAAAGQEGLATHAVMGRLHVLAFRDPERFLRDGRGEIELAIPVFDRLGDRLGLAKAWYLLAYRDWAMGRSRRALASAERARGLAAQAGELSWEATIAGLQCLILYWGPVPLEQVERTIQETLEFARRRGLRRLEAAALTIAARVAAMRGDAEEARRLVRVSNAITVDLGELLTQAADCLSEALVELLNGDLGAAERVLRGGNQALKTMGGTGPRANVLAMLARVLLRQGRMEEAEERTRECQRIAAARQLDAQLKWRAVRAVTVARRGDLEEAERLAREAVALGDGTDQEDSRAEVHVDLAEVLRLAGRRAEAERELERAAWMYDEKGNQVAAAGVRRLLAELRS